ncbi:hypothetical protein BGZ70_010208 [Mortierella alpina]|uniref:Uncharacterized protein n=1 Tax=Mortierella alpina TaxID=64518 RepID=A0A9P6JFK6_MORAP|nr:hypothetical protein BGZ70_010208 [Mortierella alpina]
MASESLGSKGPGAPAAMHKTDSTLIPVESSGHRYVGCNRPRAVDEVLHRMSYLNVIRLDQCRIDDSGAKALAEALRTNSTVVFLDLGENSIKEQGAQALAEALTLNTTLTALYLYGNALLMWNLIGPNGAQALAQSLKVNATLTTLNVYANSIGLLGAQALAEALKVNSTLTSLSLGFNSIGTNGARALAEALAMNSTLTELRLNSNAIGCDGAQALAEALKTNTTLTSLDLERTDIYFRGVQALAQAFGANFTLTRLLLKGNLINRSLFEAVSGAFKTNATLATADLESQLMRDERSRSLMEVVMDHSHATTLNLQSYAIGDSAYMVLFEALKTDSTLTTLILRYNSTGFEGAQAVAEALKINSTLTTLDLGHCWYGYHSALALALAEALNTNSTLTTLDLTCCHIGPAGAQALAETLKTNCTLTTLILYLNNIGDDGARALAEALKINCTLIALDVRENKIGDAGIMALEEAQHEHDSRPTIAGHQAFTLIDITAQYLRELIASAESIVGHNITSLVTVLPDGRNIRTSAKEIADKRFWGNYTHYDRVYAGGYNPPSTEKKMMDEATFAASRLPHRVRFESFRKTSAAIFSFDNGMEYSRGVLVYRLGGSTFEVSVQRVDGGTYNTLSSVYDPHLGGNDFNRRVIDHLLVAHKNKSGQDLSSDDTFLHWLASEVEAAKRALSVQDRVLIESKSSFPGRQGFSEWLTRSQFEELNMDLFTKTLTAIDQAIKNSVVYTKEDIQDIVFAGGSSNIPFLQSAVRDYFGHRKRYHGTHQPETTVVLGAAKMSHWYQDENHYIGPVCCLGEERRTLGIETAGGVMFKYTDRHSNLNINKMYTFSTTADNQDRVAIRVFRGGGTRTSQNMFLSGVELRGIAPAPKGVPQIRVRIRTQVCGHHAHLSVMDVASGTINGTVFPTGSWVGQERDKEALKGGDIKPAGNLSTFLAA